MRPECLHIRGMWGMGDNVYSRPFVRAAANKYEIYLETPWPELYADLNIKFVRGDRRLRTQQKNMARQPASRWEGGIPRGAREIRIGYGADIGRTSIIASMERVWSNVGVPFEPNLFNLPDMGPAPIVSDCPIAVIRPVTVRKEWRNEARNPESKYIAQLAGALMLTHRVVAVADISAGEEWLIGPLPPAHDYFVNGELAVRELLALIREANVVIGGVGWIVPTAIALKVKTFVVLGGHGGHNAPAKITDRRLDLSRIGFAMPDRFCQCTTMLHNCNKQISDLSEQFARWWNNSQAAA